MQNGLERTVRHRRASANMFGDNWQGDFNESFSLVQEGPRPLVPQGPDKAGDVEILYDSQDVPKATLGSRSYMILKILRAGTSWLLVPA